MPRRAPGRSTEAAARARVPGRDAELAVLLAESERRAAELARENVALRQERDDALEQQTATADVLRAISRSSTDLSSVLDALVDSAARLCDASGVFLTEIVADRLRTLAAYGAARDRIAHGRGGGAKREASDDDARADRLIQGVPFSRGTFSGRAVIERKTVHVADAAAAIKGEYADAKESQHRWRYRTIVAVTLVR